LDLLILIIIFTAIGGVLSVLAAGVFLLLPEKQRNHILPHGISFAIGALLAVAFWGLIPHAFEEVNPDQFQTLSGTILAGILGFFVLEKLLIWRHCHFGTCEAHGDDEHTHHQDLIVQLVYMHLSPLYNGQFCHMNCQGDDGNSHQGLTV